MINECCIIMGTKTLSSKNKIKGGDNQADVESYRLMVGVES